MLECLGARGPGIEAWEECLDVEGDALRAGDEGLGVAAGRIIDFRPVAQGFGREVRRNPGVVNEEARQRRGVRPRLGEARPDVCDVVALECDDEVGVIQVRCVERATAMARRRDPDSVERGKRAPARRQAGDRPGARGEDRPVRSVTAYQRLGDHRPRRVAGAYEQESGRSHAPSYHACPGADRRLRPTNPLASLGVERRRNPVAGICEGRVVVITGAGRGIGREHALAFAREGAKVVINDLGGSVDGAGNDEGPAQQVVDEIRAMGGEAVANTDNVTDYAGAGRIIQTALDTFGGLDVVVNNAGILRDRMFVNMTEEEFDSVIAVHLRGTFAVTRHAADYWRARAKAGETNDARIISTSSPSGIFGNIGQANYGAAKAGIAAMTIILADELGRLGVTANAIAPVALTRMTEGLPLFAEAEGAQRDASGYHPMDPANISPLVVWLGSPLSAGVTGRVFTVMGGEIGVAEPWVKGPVASKDGRWDPAELTDVVPGLVARARGNSDMGGKTR